MNRSQPLAILSVSFLAWACTGDGMTPRPPVNQGGGGGDPGMGGSPGFGGSGFGGSGGGFGGSGGSGGGAQGGTGGGVGGSGGGAGGGAGGRDAGSGGGGGGSGGGGAGGGASGGTGGRADASTPDSMGSGGGGAGGAGGAGGMPGPTAPGQGPTALGRIVYSQDFENGRAGITLSPTNLPPERAVIVDDPLGMRGKVMRVIWQMGDNYRTSSGTQPRSWISNAAGYQITVGTKVSLAWGMQWTYANMEAFFAQTIGPGPVWELRVRGNGRLNVLCNKCGGNTEHMPIQIGRWYDFRVDMDWQNGGAVRFYVDGQMFHQSTMSGATANCHWDGGIYNTPEGTASNRTRTVYISNLSVGVRP